MSTEAHASIQLLFDTYPDGVRVRDGRGRVPLHYACRSKIPMKLIRQLLSYYPGSVFVPCCHGYLPLHYACEAGSSVRRVSLLLKANPFSILQKTREGKSPLQLAFNHFWDSNAVAPYLKENAVIPFLQEHQEQAIRDLKGLIGELGLPDLVSAEIWQFAVSDMWDTSMQV